MSESMLSPQRCPCCHHELDALTRLRGAIFPRAGAVSICIYCAGVNIVAADLTLRRATVEELSVHLQDPRIVNTISTVLLMIRHRAMVN